MLTTKLKLIGEIKKKEENKFCIKLFPPMVAIRCKGSPLKNQRNGMGN